MLRFFILTKNFALNIIFTMNVINDYIDNYLIKEKGIPYLDVLVKNGHDTIYRHYQNKNGNATGKELLYMYSCSKVVTAVATMACVERGIISLDDKVSKYLPEFENSYRLVNGQKIKTKPVTIKHLITMSSGLDYNFNSPFVKQKFIQNPFATAREIANEIIKMPLHFEPGDKFMYGLSHDVLGGVIESATNSRFSDFVADEIFKPLNMKHSTFKFLEGDFEDLYHAVDGVIEPYPYEQEKWANHKTYDGGGGGLKSTVEDCSLLLETLACGGISSNGYKLIKPETIALMTVENTKVLSVKNNYTCVEGKEYGYGLGVRVRKIDTPWGLKQKEFGWDGAAGSYALVDPNTGVSVTMGMHVRNWPQVFSGEHLKLVEMIYKNLL